MTAILTTGAGTPSGCPQAPEAATIEAGEATTVGMCIIGAIAV